MKRFCFNPSWIRENGVLDDAVEITRRALEKIESETARWQDMEDEAQGLREKVVECFNLAKQGKTREFVVSARETALDAEFAAQSALSIHGANSPLRLYALAVKNELENLFEPSGYVPRDAAFYHDDVAITDLDWFDEYAFGDGEKKYAFHFSASSIPLNPFPPLSETYEFIDEIYLRVAFLFQAQLELELVENGLSRLQFCLEKHSITEFQKEIRALYEELERLTSEYAGNGVEYLLVGCHLNDVIATLDDIFDTEESAYDFGISNAVLVDKESRVEYFA